MGQHMSEMLNENGAAPDAPKPSPLWPWLALSALSGVFYFTSFAGFDVWPLAFIVFVPHLFAVERAGTTNRRTFLLGLTFGVVTNAGGYYWLVGMLGDFSGFPWPVCVAIASLLWIYQGALLGVFSLVWKWLRDRGWPSVVAVPVAFAAVEWLYPILFHSYFGATMHTVPVAMQVADLGGPILVSAVVAMVSGILDDLRRARMARQPLPLREVAAGLAIVGAALGYGAYRIHEVETRMASAPEVRVGMIQANMELDLKRMDPAEGLTRHLDQSIELEAKEHPDLIVWPESAYMYFVPEEQQNLKDYVSGRLTTPLLFGGLAQRRGKDGRPRFFNTAFLLDKHGQVLGNYDKAFLMPFGEYIPFGEQFPSLYKLSPHTGQFVQGSKHVGLNLDGHIIAPNICYEDLIPGFVRQAINETHPELIINMSNDAWFGNTTEPWEHLALAKFRAVEHHLYLLRVTNSGVTATVDPVGRVTTVGGVFKRESLITTAKYMKGSTVYQTVGDWPGWVSALVVLAVWVLARRRSSIS